MNKILIIDDDRELCALIKRSVQSEHIEADFCNTGKEGLQKLKEQEYQLVVLDVMMPGMDGFETLEEIRKENSLPILMFTSKNDSISKVRGLRAGADDYLTKPFSAKLLNSRIHNLLESRKKLAQQITAHTQELEPKALQEPMEPIELNKLDREFLEKLTHIIEENLDAELDIPFMTSKIGMSHSTFYRKVKALTGISANEFIRKVRLKNSLQLLLTGTYNISEAAYMTGFNNVSYYRQCFKDEYGMSPTEYLKSCR